MLCDSHTNTAYKAQTLLYLLRGYEFPLEIPTLDGSMAFTVFKTDDNNTTLLSAYPNPANTQLNFVYKAKTEQNTLVCIYDSKGSLVQTFSIQGNNTHTIDTNQWQTGMYYYTATTNGNTTQRSKIVVIK